MDKDSEVTSDKYTDYLEADLKKAGTYVKYSFISGYHNFGLWFLSSENRKKHYAESDKIQENFKNDLKAIDKELEEALAKEERAKKLLPIIEMELSRAKNPYVKRALKSYGKYLEKQSNTDNTFVFNAYKGAGIGLAQGTIEFYAAEAVGTTTVTLVGISMLFRGDTRIETPKENEKNSYIPKENRITIAYSDALKLKKRFTDYYSDRIGYYNILGLVENDGIPRNTSTLENDPRISEDIVRYYNGEKTKLENKGYVVGNIIGNIAGYKLASEGAFYKNNSTYTPVQNEIENVGDTAKTVRKNGQQAQKVQNSVVQNNKNSINKPPVDVSELNNQQSKPIYTNKISQEIYLSKPKQNGTLVIGAGNNPRKGAYNIDIKDSISSAVYYGDATNLVNIQTGSQAKVVIENPNGFDPTNPEILRVIKKGGELEISGVVKNPDFSKMYVDKAKTIVKVPEGFELIEAGEIPENLRKQGYRTNGTPIGQQKNGVGAPKKTDRIIRLRKIGE